MWDSRKLLLLLAIVSILVEGAQCKKKRSKRPKKQDEDDLVTFSSFGFNENGNSHDFKPSSLDMGGGFNGMSHGQETTTMGLYAPAFPTAEDTTPFNIFANNGQVSQSFSPYLNSMGVANQDSKYQSLLNHYRSKLPGYEDFNGPNKDQSSQQDYVSYDHQVGDSAPVYGTKLSAKDIPKKPSLYGDLNYQSIYSYASTWPTTNVDNLEEMKPSSSSSFKSPFKTGPPTSDLSGFKGNFQNDYAENTHSSMSTDFKASHPLKDTFTNNKYSYSQSSINDDQKDAFQSPDNDSFKPTVNILPNGYKNPYKNLNYSDSKYNFKNTELYSNYKDQFKDKPAESHDGFNSLDFNEWKGSVKTHNNYATIKDNSKYTDNNPGTKMQHAYPDYTSSQSNIKNVIDFTGDNYPFKDAVHESDFSSEKDPNFKHAIDFTNIMSQYTSGIDHSTTNSWKPPKNNFPSDEALTKHFGFDFTNPTKSTFDVPTMTTQWGNIFKTYENKNILKPKKPYSSNSQIDGDTSESIIHIPKKSQSSKFTFGKLPKGKTIEEWNKDVSERFKSEEELLGLRNHDTSHPSYLPTYKLKDELDDMQNYASNFNYGNALEKWRYLHSKSKNPNQLDYLPSGSQHNGQSMHVPYPKPYPIEVPHPVIVPVPQPYPVRVPVPRPVAVPVVRELRIPVERPVPYPVIKNVPYPVERPVPVPIEKPVAVPVMKPYPVPIPHVRPVFHHSRPRPPRGGAWEPAGDGAREPAGGGAHGERDEAALRRERERDAPAERILLRPVKNRRARLRPRRPSAQSRINRRSPRRPAGRRAPPGGSSRRVSRPHSPRSPPRPGRFPGDRPSNPTAHSERPSSQNGDRFSNPAQNGERSPNPEQEEVSAARYAPGFRDLTLEDSSEDHDHDDYFKYCQNNPLCYIQSLKMPLME